MRLVCANLNVLEKPHYCGLSADCFGFRFYYYTELISVLQGRFPPIDISCLLPSYSRTESVRCGSWCRSSHSTQKHAGRAARGRQIRLLAITGTDKKNPTALNAVGFPVLLFHNRKQLMKAWSLLIQTGNRLPDPQ